MDELIYYVALGIVGYLGLGAFVALHVFVYMAYRARQRAQAHPRQSCYKRTG